MGQLLQQDNIPNIVVASTTSVTLAATSNGQPTLITVGGQQYTPSATLTLATGSTGANGLDTGSLGSIQLWYVYAIVNSSTFAPALIASQTGPATGPTIPGGYFAAYKLVGAFYTNGSSQVGSIATISGTITTAWTSFTPSISWSGNVSSKAGSFRRVGDTLELDFVVVLSGAPTETGSQFNLTLPGSLAIDLTKFQSSTSRDGVGSGVYYSAANGYFHVVNEADSSTTIRCMALQIASSNTHVAKAISQTNNVPTVGLATGDILNAKVHLPISGWNATLL